MSAAEATAGDTGQKGFLGWIERVGNKVPHPAIIFLGLIIGVIVLSAVMAWAEVSVTTEVAESQPQSESQVYDDAGSSYPSSERPPGEAVPDYEIKTETIEAQSLLSGDGIRFIFTTAVQNFNDFGVVAVILVAMIGVGVAEEAGLIAALIRKMVQVAPASMITFIIVLLGGISSVASDAGYLVLIPLGAAAFVSLGRHPLAGIAAAYAGVSAAFFVNILITPADGIITEVTNEIMGGAAPGADPLNVTQNLYFSIASTLFTALVMTVLTERFVEPRLGKWDPAERPAGAVVDHVPSGDELSHESRGLRLAGIYTLVAVAIVSALTFIPDAPLRNPETGEIFGNSPFMSSLLFIISMLFLAAGLGYGKGAGSLTGATNVINAIVKTFNGLGGLIFLMLLIAQFIAYFNYSNISNIAATKLADLLGQAEIGALLAAGPLCAAGVRDRPDHARRHPQVGHHRADLHPALLQPRDRPSDSDRGLPRRRRTGQRDHPTDGLSALHHPGLPALPRQLRHGDRGLDDDPLHRRGARDLAPVLRRLVPRRDPMGPRLPGPPRVGPREWRIRPPRWWSWRSWSRCSSGIACR